MFGTICGHSERNIGMFGTISECSERFRYTRNDFGMFGTISARSERIEPTFRRLEDGRADSSRGGETTRQGSELTKLPINTRNTESPQTTLAADEHINIILGTISECSERFRHVRSESNRLCAGWNTEGPAAVEAEKPEQGKAHKYSE